MRFFYDLIFLIFSIIYLPYLVVKGKAHRDFIQRFGFLPQELKCRYKNTVWVHTVSVGEVMAANSFVRHLKEAFPAHRIVLSTTTKTGQETAKRIFGKDIPTFYFPLDFQFTVERTLNFINPCIFIVLETEIWPNLIMGLARRDVPIFLVNGRISDKSFRGYRLVRFALRPILKKIDLFCMQTEDDAERARLIGSPSGKIKITGNIKYDVSHEKRISPRDMDIKMGRFGVASGEPVIICGSTHKGEEEILVNIYKDLLKDFNNLRLVIAPRHIDRAGEICDLCKKLGFETLKISEIRKEGNRPSAPVVILDTIGQLTQVYSIGTVVFVGGSLVKRGGHNIIEPACFAKPIVFGPHMSNFRDMAKRFLKSNASIMVDTKGELKTVLEDLLRDESKRRRMGQIALQLVEENRGAVSRVIELIQGRMNQDKI